MNKPTDTIDGLIKQFRSAATTLRDNACKSKNTHKCGQAVFRNKSYGMADVYCICADALESLTQPVDGEAINIIFDGPLSHESGRFVEVENDQGKSIKIGEWIHQKDGFWALRIVQPVPTQPTGEAGEVVAELIYIESRWIDENRSTITNAIALIQQQAALIELADGLIEMDVKAIATLEKRCSRMKTAIMEMHHDNIKGDFELSNLARLDLDSCVDAASTDRG